MSYILVTSGTDFIGDNFVLNRLVDPSAGGIINVDKLTYTGNYKALATVKQDSRHVFSQTDICDHAALDRSFTQYRPRAVVHFAVESHVDRSIHGPGEFTQTNIIDTFILLEAACTYQGGLDDETKTAPRFLHVSMDEVSGSLDPTDPQFSKITPYASNSPCSAFEAASGHLMRVYHHTYRLPVPTTSCSNNYGPCHFPEKLILLMIINALSGKPLLVYGDSQSVRDWLYMGNHCATIRGALARGRLGETYNTSDWNEKANLDVIYILCDLLDELKSRVAGFYRDRTIFVEDRPGHDRRYAIDARKPERELGWKPTGTLETGLQKTVQWYLDNQAWVQDVVSGEYQNWVTKQYAA